MHTFDDETEQLALAIQHWIHERRAKPPNRVGRPVTAAELGERLGNTVTADGIGWREALRIFTDELIPVSNPHDRPINLSFIPTAPTEAACLFDGAVGAAGVIGTQWMAGCGLIHAENDALRWLVEVVGYPASAGGVFVSGGTTANLSALVAARGDRPRGGNAEAAAVARCRDSGGPFVDSVSG